MNWLDIVILVVLAVATFTGLKSGLIKTVLSLAGLIIGIMLAGQFYDTLAGRLTFIPQENVAQVVAFVLILVVVLVTASILAAVLKWITSLVMLGWVNHLGGAVAGFFLGAILAGALLALWVKFPGSSATIQGSGLAQVLLDRFPLVLALLPDEFDAIRRFFQ